jgi:hypothetical protein
MRTGQSWRYLPLTTVHSSSGMCLISTPCVCVNLSPNWYGGACVRHALDRGGAGHHRQCQRVE